MVPVREIKADPKELRMQVLVGAPADCALREIKERG
jgi:hypothetical protein